MIYTAEKTRKLYLARSGSQLKGQSPFSKVPGLGGLPERAPAKAGMNLGGKRSADRQRYPAALAISSGVRYVQLCSLAGNDRRRFENYS